MEFCKAQRMMLGIAVGDALGREYENIPRREIHIGKIPEGYSKGTGIYTDDTQMSIAVAETMLSGEPFSAERLADNFVRAYGRDRREGYSRETLGMLENSRNGDEFVASMKEEEKSERKSDGSAMRAVPIGLFPDIKDVIENAIINSKISHAHTHAVSASVAVALASNYFYYDKGPRNRVVGHIILHMEQIWAEVCNYLKKIDELEEFDPVAVLGEHADYGPPYTDAMPVLGAVLFMIKKNYDDPIAAITETLSLGGDADTTLSMVLGILLADHPVELLPERLFSDLENGDYGRDYLLDLGKRLDRVYPPR